MNADNASSQLPLARPPAEGIGPQRERLCLSGGYETSVYLHEPRGGGRRQAVVYLHGIQSHPGWFAGSAAALAGRGHPVVQPTRRGSGDNTIDRGHALSARQLLEDVDAACCLAAESTRSKRVHLVGVSWGGKLAACYAADRKRTIELASLTLIAPGISARVDVGLAAKLGIALSLAVCPRRLFDIPLSEVELFTDNEEMRRYLREDPWRLHRATARFLYVSRSLDRILRRATDGCLDMPVTLILSERDRIIDNAATQKLVSRLAGARLEVRQLPGAHTLEFEVDPQPLYDTLITAVERGE